MPKSPNLKAGSQRGRLTIIKFSHQDSEYNRVWCCRCSCGKIVYVCTNKLNKGAVKSCGCLKLELGKKWNKHLILPNHQAEVNRLFGRYKKEAKHRGYSFDLPMEVFKKLLNSDCYYCGAGPSNSHLGLKYNGIDRRDNSLGYANGNAVPCCWECNRAKRDRTVEEFIAHAQRIVACLQLRKQEAA